jgi:hypothetical protein
MLLAMESKYVRERNIIGAVKSIEEKCRKSKEENLCEEVSVVRVGLEGICRMCKH